MANFNFNKVIIGGRLTADPKLEVTPGGTSVTSFVIAVNKARKGREADGSADFFTVIAWRELAEFITLYFRKASSICIVGGIHSRKWVDKTTGQNRYTVEIWADEAYFVDAKTEMPLSPEKTGDMIADPGAEVLAGGIDDVPGHRHNLGDDDVGLDFFKVRYVKKEGVNEGAENKEIPADIENDKEFVEGDQVVQRAVHRVAAGRGDQVFRDEVHRKVKDPARKQPGVGELRLVQAAQGKTMVINRWLLLDHDHKPREEYFSGSAFWTRSDTGQPCVPGERRPCP